MKHWLKEKMFNPSGYFCYIWWFCRNQVRKFAPRGCNIGNENSQPNQPLLYLKHYFHDPILTELSIPILGFAISGFVDFSSDIANHIFTLYIDFSS